jgi:hypothetical protein
MKGIDTMLRIARTIIMILCVGHFAVGCANIIPPSGGDRDSLPPVLVTALPKDSATQVKSRNITLTFDEFVQLKETENIIVSPLPKNVPIFDYKLRNVTVRLRDSLEPNTTYSIDFGTAIRDVNEDNIAQNFRYVFSTGTTIDNNSYEGQVLVAESGKPDSTLIVILHTNLADSAIFKKTPRYFTRVNGKGQFRFQNLPAGKFNVFVLNGKSFNKQFDSTELFAFRNELLELPVTGRSNDTLLAFKELVPSKEGKSSAGQMTTSFREDKRLRYQNMGGSEPQDLQNDLTLLFNRTLGTIDSSKMQLLDSNYRAVGNFRIKLSEDKKQVSISHPWKQDFAYRLMIDKDAITDSAGMMLGKNDTIRIQTQKESAYGTLRYRFQNLDTSVHPVIQMVQNDEIVGSYPINTPNLVIPRIKPGNYDLRILYDQNRNGRWDTGVFSTQPRKQPEKVVSIPRPLSIRANWDNEVTIGL